MRLFATFLSCALLGTTATSCATSSSSGTRAKDGAAKAPKEQDARSGREDEAKPAPSGAASTPTAPRPQGATFGPLPVDGDALVGAWRGKDARDIIGTLNFCKDGRAKAVINGERLGGKGGSLLTWTATKIDAGEAKIELVASAQENVAPFLMVAKRTSETEMMVAAVKGNVTRVEGAPAEDRVRLERVSTDASCD